AELAYQDGLSSTDDDLDGMLAKTGETKVMSNLRSIDIVDTAQQQREKLVDDCPSAHAS
ncbi:hypothetical protein HAX54_036168, partial [Datura stramonium]|nr:hypothetical protein [Datura stramonium]